MRLQPVTIGVGRAYERMARLAAESVQHYTGLEPAVITDTADCHPAWYKLRLLDLYPDAVVFFFDADTRMVRDWDLRRYETLEGIAAVLDRPSLARAADCERYQITPSRYINTGLWLAGPSCRDAFRAARELGQSPDYQTGFRFEQTALNVALQRAHVHLLAFPTRYNAICDRYPPANLPVVLHVAGATLHGVNRRRFEKAIVDAQTTTP